MTPSTPPHTPPKSPTLPLPTTPYLPYPVTRKVLSNFLIVSKARRRRRAPYFPTALNLCIKRLCKLRKKKNLISQNLVIETHVFSISFKMAQPGTPNKEFEPGGLTVRGNSARFRWGYELLSERCSFRKQTHVSSETSI